MLVQVQRPGAAAVASRREWHKRGRTVLADAIPIVLLQPFVPVRFVFKVSDTEGREISGEKASSLFAEGSAAKSLRQHPQGGREARIKVVETDQYGALLAGTAAGIAVQPALDRAQ